MSVCYLITRNSHNELDLSTTLFQLLQRYMFDIYSVIGPVDDIGSVYRNLRPIWANNTSSHLIDPCVRILSKIPCSRFAVLNYLGMLIHEATHLHLSKKENPHIGTDTTNIERAVRKLTGEFRRILSTVQSKGLAFDILVWACNLFVEICKLNYERPIAKTTGITASALLGLFDSCPSITNAIKLTDKAIAFLLHVAPEECLSVLIDASANGFCFAWIWMHIAVSFPDTIVAHLLRLGIQELMHYHSVVQNNKASIDLHESYKQKFLLLCDVFTFLANQNNTELRNAARELITKDRENLESEITTPEQMQCFSLPFLIKMIASSTDLLRFLVHSTYDLVTTKFVVNGVKYISLLDRQCLLPILSNTDYNYTAFIRQMTFYLDSNALAHIVEIVLPIAFDDNIFRTMNNCDQSLCSLMKDGALQILSDIIGKVLSSVHNQTAFNVNDNAVLKRCACNPEVLKETIGYAMAGGEKSKLFIPYIHSFCIASGPVRTTEVIARFIMEAEDEKQLACLNALLSSLIIFNPKIPENAIISFLSNRTVLMLQKQNETLDSSSFEYFYDVKWLYNLRTLHEWEKMADDEHIFKHIRYKMRKHFGELMTEILRWMLDAVSSLKEKDKSEVDQSIKAKRDAVVLASLSLCSSLGPAPVLEPRYPYKLNAQFASLVVLLLDFVGQKNDHTALSLFTTTCTSIAGFLNSQVGYVREQFIIHLLDEVFAKASQLFGSSSLHPWETELQFPGDLQSSSSSVDESNTYGNELFQNSLLDMVRKSPIVPHNPVHLAHSGVIGRGPKRLDPKNVESGNKFRRLVFMEYLQRFCNSIGPDQTLKPYHQVYKQMGMRLTDRVCKSGLTAAFIWEEWEQAREIIPRYIAVSKRLAEIPLIWDVMLAVAEVHPCLWYCCPLLKAYLAVIMIQLENCPDQLAPPRKQLIEMLDKWFFLTRKGQMLPEKMVHYFEIIKRVTCREGFFVILDIWKYFQNVLDAEVPAANMINSAFDRSLNSSTDLIKGDPTKFRESCRIVIQRNISKLGYLFQLIFSDELGAQSNSSENLSQVSSAMEIE
ncbi:unnamed protein product [Thelazia callipaeda]|uniref:INTS5_C domain-containing protein n=1 Tax=Thelazia callipaeda TaxID=103827 RepID=A0A0N5CWH7_THECL|nr:unnamed protein product [Thelazia callipaeda]